MTARKIITATIVSVVATFLPGFVVVALGWQSLESVGILASVACFIAAIMGGWRMGLALAPLLAVAVVLATLSAGSPLFAALVMAFAAGLRGYSSARGLSGVLSLAPITLAFVVAQPPTSDLMPAWLAAGLVALIAGLYAALFPFVLRSRLPAPRLTVIDHRRAAVFAITSAIVIGVSTWVVVAFDLRHGGAWFVMTILIVLQPFTKDSLTKTAYRAAGTTLGFAFTMLVAALVSAPAVFYAVGVLAIGMTVITFIKHRPYWHYATFLTIAVVMLEGASSSVIDLDVERLAATLAGSALALVATAVTLPLQRRVDPTRHEPVFRESSNAQPSDEDPRQLT